MLPDLERLIRLQQLETAVATARQSIEAFPAKREALETSLAEHTGQLDAAEQRLAENKAARRDVEKEAAGVEKRLATSRDHSMAVKTNKELWAIQAEIERANTDLRRFEDRILELMIEADDLTSSIAAARQALAEEQAAVGEEQRRLEQERERHRAQVARHARDREEIVSGLSPRLPEMFDTLMRGRKGIAVSEVHDGRCRSCQVRLRPQLYNDVRLNQRLIQCETCQRILYYATGWALDVSGCFEWPSTDAPASKHGFTGDFFDYKDGLLSYVGYRVGKTGESESIRRRILDCVFNNKLPNVDSFDYMKEWADPKTSQRLEKMAHSLAAFVRNAKRRTDDLSEAVGDWDADLRHLHDKYYVGKFHFSWPQGSDDHVRVSRPQ